MGVLIAPLFVIVSLIGGLANKSSHPFGPLVGIILALLIPFFYGGIGCVMGAFSAFLYNLLAQWIGGIEVELQTLPLPDSMMPLG